MLFGSAWTEQLFSFVKYVISENGVSGSVRILVISLCRPRLKNARQTRMILLVALSAGRKLKLQVKFYKHVKLLFYAINKAELVVVRSQILFNIFKQISTVFFSELKKRIEGFFL